MILDTIRQYTPLAKNIARAFVLKLPKNVLREDLEQAAMIGLFDAARKNAHYADPSKEVPGFEYYVRKRIRGAIIDELRAQDWLPRRARGKAAEGGPPPVVVRFEDLGGAPDEPYHWQERFAGNELSPEETAIVRDEHRHALAAPLNDRDRKVIDMTERRGMRFQDVAKVLGVSEPRISQLHARSIAVMRAHLTGDATPRPGRCGGMYVEARIAKATIRRIIQQREQNEHQDDSGVDRTARGRQAGHPRPEPEPDRVRASGLGRAPAERAARAVPGRGGLARVDGAGPSPRTARGRAHAIAIAVPDWEPESDWRELAMTPSLALPAPSTLPEDGIDMEAELARYREWMLDQALLRTGGNRTHAAALLRVNRTTLVEMLKRRDGSGASTGRLVDLTREQTDALIAETLDRTGNITETARVLGVARTTVWRRAGALKDRCRVVTELEEQVASHVASAPEPVPELVPAREEHPVMTQPDVVPEPSPAEPEPVEPEPVEPEPQTLPGTESAPERERPPSEPPSAVHVRVGLDPYRVTRANVARLKAEGLSVRQIAGRLCVNRFWIEKLLRPIGPAKCGERRG